MFHKKLFDLASYSPGTRDCIYFFWIELFSRLGAIISLLYLCFDKVDWRLVCQPFPAQAEDVCNALEFIPSIAENFHIDTDKIFIMGNSSGGHIAMMSALFNAHKLYAAWKIYILFA